MLRLARDAPSVLPFNVYVCIICVVLYLCVCSCRCLHKNVDTRRQALLSSSGTLSTALEIQSLTGLESPIRLESLARIPQRQVTGLIVSQGHHRHWPVKGSKETIQNGDIRQLHTTLGHLRICRSAVSDVMFHLVILSGCRIPN
jgi:hypothetical protein